MLKDDQLLSWYNALHNRQERLIRLRELEAPPIIIDKEHELIAQAQLRIQQLESMTQMNYVA
jgi:hypothetical protein